MKKTNSNNALNLFFWVREGALYIVILAVFLLPQIAISAVDEVMMAAGWDEISFDDKGENQFSMANADAVSAATPLSQHHIQLVSKNSVSVAFYPFSKNQINLSSSPYLNFSWQYSGDKIDTDVSKKGGDDRILSVYAAFAYQPEHASFKERLSRPIVEGLHGKDAPGRLINYLWASKPRSNVWIENPYTGEAGYMKIISNLRVPQGQWVSQKVNILQDFVELYGFEPEQLLYIAIAADTDDTKSSIISEVKDISFTSQ